MELGKIGLTPKGAFNINNAPYENLDIVIDNGKVYLSKKDDNNDDLKNLSSWELWVQSGSNAQSFNYKGNVNNYAGLPSSGNVINDAYYNSADLLMYVYNGTSFPTQGNGIKLQGSTEIEDWVAGNYFEKSLVIKDSQIFRVKDGKTATASDIPNDESEVWKRIISNVNVSKNNMLNPHEYGISGVNILSGNLFYDSSNKFWKSENKIVIIVFPSTIFKGEYFGIVVDKGAQVTSLRTRDAGQVKIDDYSRRNIGDKDILYLKIKNANDIYLYTTDLINLKIYNFIFSDQNIISNEDGLLITEQSQYDEVFTSYDRRISDVLIDPDQTVFIGDNRLYYYKSNFFKKYIIAKVETPYPNSLYPTLQFRLSNTANTSLKNVVCIVGKNILINTDGVDLSLLRKIGISSYLNNTTGSTGSIRLTDLRTSNSNSIYTNPKKDIPSYQSFYEGKDRGDASFRVGKIFYTGKNIPFSKGVDLDGLKGFGDKSSYEYTGKRLVTKEVVNKKFIDLRGAVRSGLSGRNLADFNTETGIMTFTNAGNFEQISFSDFMASMIPHDGSDLDYNRLSYINLPDNASDSDKQNSFNKMKLDWLMPSASFNPTIINGNGINNHMGARFSNGNIVVWDKLLKPNGEVITPKLKNPIIGNVVSVKVNNNETFIENTAHSLILGKIKIDQGSTTYPEERRGAINFINGAEFSINVNLQSGIIPINIIMRRNGTTIVDGNINLFDENNNSIGVISISGNSTSVREVANINYNLNIANSITKIRFVVSCATDKDLIIGNGLSSAGAWGRTADGRFGTIVEYVAAPARGSGKCYFSSDFGETWQDVFDNSLNTIYTSSIAYHLHGARYDKWWKRLMIVHGDNDQVQYGSYADASTETTVNNVNFLPLLKNNNLYFPLLNEQHCSVFPTKDYIIYGSDYSINGIWIQHRIDKSFYGPTEPAFLLQNDGKITHIPTSFFQKSDDSEIFSLAMGGDNLNTIKKNYRSAILFSSLDGNTWREAWKDEIGNGSFSQNINMNVFEYGKYIVLSIYSDGRFRDNHSLVVLEYM